MIEGIIIKGIAGFYYVKSKKDIYECKARGKFRKEKVIPMVGDNVQIQILDETNKKGSIEKIDKRKTFLQRPPVSNVNQAVIVIAASFPTPNLFLLDKLILYSEIQKIDILICINKIDLVNKEKYLNIKAIYEKAGYKVVCISCKMNNGIENLRELLNNKISVFAGVSGVGKSSILNCIDERFTLQIGEISKKIKRGRHTTRHVELYELNSGGFVLDTPGFSSLEIPIIKKDELGSFFKDFKDLSSYCRFSGCSHTSEPGCRVIEELKAKNISQSRYDSYIQIYNIIKDIKEWEQ